ncbi:MAG TPA: hypothetical protein VGR73_12635 [Bryobacteraceae bacterium]|nr:hypothetical protein [Bryobacteraceae bacterium]
MSPWSLADGAAILTAILLQVPLSAQPARPEKIDVAKLGPQVGQQVPDFNLKDQNGATRNLESIMGPQGAMLVFIRSADW